MPQPNEQYVELTLTGSFDPAEITAMVGFPPHESWRTGEMYPHAKLKIERPLDGWLLRSRLATAEPLEAHLADLLSQMEQQREAFTAVAQRYNGVVRLVGYFYEDYPGLYLDSSLLTRVAQLHISLDFDFYYLWSETAKSK